MRVLYVTYDGLLDPLGQSQVLPYIEGLARRYGHTFDVISFEKRERFGDVAERESLAQRLDRAGIGWHPRTYHKRVSPIATTYDVWSGRRMARRLSARRSVDVVHCRSYVATLIGRSAARAAGIPYVFDMRGLWAEERVDGGVWRGGGPLHRMAKRYERSFLADAGAIVTLTRASVPTVEAWARAAGSGATVDVIPTAVDLDLFQPLSPGDETVIGYVGSVGATYAVDRVIAFFVAVSEISPGARCLVLSNNGKSEVCAEATLRGVESRVEVRSVPHASVPLALEGVGATVCFLRPGFSNQARCLTKVGESLALGIPVVVNDGVGDSAELVRRDRVGVVVPDLSDGALRRGAEELRELLSDAQLGGRCVHAARSEFALDAAVDQYHRIYERLAAAVP